MPVSTDLEPKAEHLRKAIRWISDRRREQADAKLASLLDEAGLRFDLTPQECEFLRSAFLEPPPGER